MVAEDHFYCWVPTCMQLHFVLEKYVLFGECFIVANLVLWDWNITQKWEESEWVKHLFGCFDTKGYMGFSSHNRFCSSSFQFSYGLLNFWWRCQLKWAKILILAVRSCPLGKTWFLIYSGCSICVLIILIGRCYELKTEIARADTRLRDLFSIWLLVKSAGSRTDADASNIQVLSKSWIPLKIAK